MSGDNTFCTSGDTSNLSVEMEEQEGSSDDKEEVRLTAADIPGAELSEPLEKHPVAALRWWLLCRGVIVPTSVRKKELIDRLAPFTIIL